jgi:hypothetical protein
MGKISRLDVQDRDQMERDERHTSPEIYAWKYLAVLRICSTSEHLLGESKIKDVRPLRCPSSLD